MLAPTFSLSYSKVFPCAKEPLNFSFFFFFIKMLLGIRRNACFGWWWLFGWVISYSIFIFNGANLNVWKSMESIDGKVYIPRWGEYEISLKSSKLNGYTTTYTNSLRYRSIMSRTSGTTCGAHLGPLMIHPTPHTPLPPWMSQASCFLHRSEWD